MASEKKLPIILDEDQGYGVLSARALWASLVGPQRLAMVPRKPVMLRSDQAVEVYKNLGVSDGYVLVGVALPIGLGVNPLSSLPVIFGREDTLGNNTGWPVTLIDSPDGLNKVNFSFTQLLMPGEQLFAQITDPLVSQYNVVVASAIF